MSGHALVVGLGITGEAVARQLRRRGWHATLADDAPTAAAHEAAARLGLTLTEAPSVAELERLVAAVDVVLPSPGVRIAHPVFAAAERHRKPVWTELELAAQWDDRPVVAITGTNGKTTVVTLVTAMLNRAGRRAVSGGNTEVPLVDALDTDAEVFVVEASSFRLLFTETFAPAVATWLNFAEDHLDWHPTMEHYAAAKARIWAHQATEDVAVANAEDDVVMAAVAGVAARVETFGIRTGDYRVDDGVLAGPDGAIVAVDGLPRRLPHDLANALAASATALAAGATVEACRDVLVEFRGLPHRVQLVGDSGGVRFYDDSKATTPASVLAALTAFDSVVLIAGGRGKGLDLGVLRGAGPRVRAVVAIGEAAGEVAAAFDGVAPVELATSMDDAVARAAAAAQTGDAVLLSPGCASYDWYKSYGERGDDFRRAVAELIEAS